MIFSIAVPLFRLPEKAAWLIKTPAIDSHGPFLMQAGFGEFLQFFKTKNLFPATRILIQPNKVLVISELKMYEEIHENHQVQAKQYST
ncbi:MAG: hypothetical protein FJ190_01970 [Gammaproteobacteria bacterium]|nr:hypothetical protein [Gammaproteobacteria bacterium]